MSDIDELVKRLRVCENFDPDQKDAADALEAQAERIAGLEYEARLFDEALGNAHARIAELEATITAATVILSEIGVPTEDKNEDAFNVLTDAISSSARTALIEQGPRR